jgi:hypothetical protein
LPPISLGRVFSALSSPGDHVLRAPLPPRTPTARLLQIPFSKRWRWEGAAANSGGACMSKLLLRLLLLVVVSLPGLSLTGCKTLAAGAVGGAIGAAAVKHADRHRHCDDDDHDDDCK